MKDNVHSLLGPYVVNAVTPAERDAFRDHMVACEDCRDEVASLTEVTATLADAQAVTPPRSLRDSVMAEAAQTAQLLPLDDGLDATATGTTHAVTETTETTETTTVSAPVTDISVGSTRHVRGSHRFGRRGALAGIAAASVLLMAAAGIGLSVHNSRQEQLVAEQELMMVTTAPDAHSMDLDLGAAHLVMSDRMNGLVAMGHEAPMPDKGMEYQLWLVMDDGKSMPGPTFMPEEDGEFVAIMHTSFDGVTGFAVTQEPTGGSQEPTSNPVSEVQL